MTVTPKYLGGFSEPASWGRLFPYVSFHDSFPFDLDATSRMPFPSSRCAASASSTFTAAARELTSAAAGKKLVGVTGDLNASCRNQLIKVKIQLENGVEINYTHTDPRAQGEGRKRISRHVHTPSGPLHK